MRNLKDCAFCRKFIDGECDLVKCSGWESVVENINYMLYT